MALIELDGIGRQADGKVILRGVDLKIEASEVLAVIGPTGAGKTTLLRLIDLLDAPSTGHIHFDGVDVTRSRQQRFAARRRMALVQQKPIVFSMDVFSNIACGLRWRGRPPLTIREKVEQALDLIGMADYRHRDARTLSGGEMQRIAIARALVTEPEVLLLDEPTANLDPVSTARIEEVLGRVIREKRATVVMTTHDMSQGQRLAQKIAVLMDGRIVQAGGKAEIFRRPLDVHVAGFVGMQNIIRGMVISNDAGTAAIQVDGGSVESISDYVAGEQVCACVRPEDIILSYSRTSSSARNIFEGEIKSIVQAGPLANVELDCGFPLVALVTTRSAQEMVLEPGKHVYASFKATAVHVVRAGE